MRAAVLLQSLPKHILHDFPVFEGWRIFDRRKRSAVNSAKGFFPRTEAVFDIVPTDNFHLRRCVSDIVHAGFQVNRKLVLGIVLVLNDKINVFVGDLPLNCGEQFRLTLRSQTTPIMG